MPSECPKAFSHLIKRCWSSNPDKRPDFDEIVSILESYSESLEEDPEFFSTYKPPAPNVVVRFLPHCIRGNRSSFKA